jgi:ParB-like chromosome segregation protein Spo0J
LTFVTVGLLVEAAQRAGLEKIPCWVVELDDDAAFMLLVTCNAQGELKPLEIGLHVLKAVAHGEKGRGKKGGVRSYAEMVGKDESYIRQLRDAAEAYQNADLSPHFLDLAKHLATPFILHQRLRFLHCPEQRLNFRA